MTLAELRALDFPALWAGLTVERQAEIGTAALAVQFAQLVAEDDGDDTTRDDRLAALTLASEAQDGLEAATEVAFPAVEWWTP